MSHLTMYLLNMGCPIDRVEVVLERRKKRRFFFFGGEGVGGCGLGYVLISMIFFFLLCVHRIWWSLL